jgi:hypothetical protein
MLSIVKALLGYLAGLPRAIVRAWDRFFFTPKDPILLGIIRILVGSIVLYVHLSSTSEALNFVGPEAWIDAEALPELATLADKERRFNPTQEEKERALQTDLDIAEVAKSFMRQYGFSIWYVVTDPKWVMVTYYAGIVCVLLFTLGLFTRVTSVLSWAFHLSYLHRSVVIWFGMDAMFSFMLLYLALSPCNAVFSLDRVLARVIKGRPLPPAAPSSWATVCLRLIQLHMCVVYFISGVAKLKGESWWVGLATWQTMNAPLFNEGLPTEWMTDTRLGEWFWHYVSFGTTYLTLAFEIAFPFLIWNRHLRPWLIAAAVVMHGGIAVFMGLGGFGAIMLTNCLAFVPPAGARWFLASLAGKRVVKSE